MAFLEAAGAIAAEAIAAIAVGHRRHLDEGFRQFVDEARGQGGLPQIVDAAVLGEGNGGAALGAGDADIGEAALFLEAGAAFLVERALMREQAFLPAGQEHGAEFQALGGVQAS